MRGSNRSIELDSVSGSFEPSVNISLPRSKDRRILFFEREVFSVFRFVTRIRGVGCETLDNGEDVYDERKGLILNTLHSDHLFDTLFYQTDSVL